MSLTPTVTVQIVTYNSADDIEACLRAVQQQTYPVETVLVIDNASHDLTVERVQQEHRIHSELGQYRLCTGP